jgi:parallel beta-helix repeat protein
MSFNFPNSPTLAQTFAPAGGPTYVWDGSAWRAIGPAAGPATVLVSDTPPPNPGSNQLWWESDTSKLYIWYSDADSSQWVQIYAGPTGATGPEGPAGPIGPVGPTPSIEPGLHETTLGVASETIPVTTNAIQTSGYAVAGDGGGALYKRVSSAPAHAGKVQSMDGAWWELAETVVRPQMFGATGVGDETVKLQNMFDVAGLRKLSVADDDAAKTYTVNSTVRVKAGTKAVVMRSTLKGGGSTLNGILHLDGTTVYVAPQVDDCLITINMDMSAGDWMGLYCDGNDRCRIEGCRIYGSYSAPGAPDLPENNRRAIYLPNGASHNYISGNDIDLQSEPVPRHFGIDMSSGGIADAGGFFDIPPTVTPAANPNLGNVITGNKIRGGSYGINLQGSQDTVITGNYFRDQNHRSVYIGNTAMHNLVASNRMEDFTSTAVLIGYNSRYNTVVANRFRTSAHGEATINITTGGSYNSILSNTFDAETGYAVYMAVNASGNAVIGNDIRNHYHCAVVVEANWEDTPPAGAAFHRSSFGGAPTTINPAYRPSWAYDDTTSNVIKDNVIHHGAAGRTTGAFAIYSYLGGGADYGVRDTVIEGNVIASTTNIGTDLNFYEQTAGKITGVKLRGNTFPTLHPGGRMAALAAGISSFAQISGNSSTYLNNLSENFAVGDLTPSVGSGRQMYAFANTAPTSITFFDDGWVGQEIQVRLDSNTTIVYTSGLIRPVTLANIVGSSNTIVTFRLIGTIWMELGRV